MNAASSRQSVRFRHAGATAQRSDGCRLTFVNRSRCAIEILKKSVIPTLPIEPNEAVT
ncbi:MAG TPA: hypothetical protein VJ743_13420 [Albitalea sp.]|nr:hypothetical protein [Albitalea sp.]